MADNGQRPAGEHLSHPPSEQLVEDGLQSLEHYRMHMLEYRLVLTPEEQANITDVLIALTTILPLWYK